MTASIDLSKVSPSSVGNYAACTQRLVWDTDFPAPYESKPAADFGTLCHYWAMWKLGLNPPPIKDEALIEETALIVFKGNRTKFEKAMDDATNRAADRIKAITLKPGVRWLCEQTRHNANILPARVSRKGAKGWGGNIDVLASDNSQLWDFKFVKELPKKVKIAYLWQMAGYHIIDKVPVCGLLWTSRDGSESISMKLDFRVPAAADFARQVEGFINSTGHENFRCRAYTMVTDACEDFCNHQARCYSYNLPSFEGFESNQLIPSSGGLDALMELTALARTTEDGKLF